MSVGEARGRVVLAVAPNGGRKTRADHPALPLSADELARTAAECLERGASMIHLHVRDAEGRPCLDPEAYRAAISRICEAVGDRLVLQITSELLGRYSPAEQRDAVLRTNPEAVSLALRELAPEAADEKDFGEFLAKLRQMRVWPQIILYTPAEAQRLGAMQKQGLIPFDKLSVLYVLGRFALTRTAIPRDLLPFLAPTRPGSSRGARARSAGARPPASPPPRCSGAMRGSASRTISPSPMASAPARTPNWSAPPPAPSKRSAFRPRPRTASGRRSRRRCDRPALCETRMHGPSKTKQIQIKPSKHSLDLLGLIWRNRDFSMGYGRKK